MRSATLIKNLTILSVLFVTGLIEVYFGIAKTLPVSWAMAGLVAFLWGAYAVVTAIIHDFTAAFKRGPNGEIPFPELKGSNVDFESVYRGHGPCENTESQHSEPYHDIGSGYKGFHPDPFDGPNPFFSEENLTGKFF